MEYSTPELNRFLTGKSVITVSLFWHLIDEFSKLGDIKIYPAKTMIGIGVEKKVAYVTRLGKNFVDVVFPLGSPWQDNLCFVKIAQVPGTLQFNHHLRIFAKEDINEEVIKFMELALRGIS